MGDYYYLPVTVHCKDAIHTLPPFQGKAINKRLWCLPAGTFILNRLRINAGDDFADGLLLWNPRYLGSVAFIEVADRNGVWTKHQLFDLDPFDGIVFTLNDYRDCPTHANYYEGFGIRRSTPSIESRRPL